MLGIVSVDCTRRTLVGDSSRAQQKTGSSSRKKTRASIRPGMLTHIHEGCDYDPHPCYPFRLLAEGCDFWTGCDGEEAEESGRWSGLCPTWLRRWMVVFSAMRGSNVALCRWCTCVYDCSTKQVDGWMDG